MYKSCSRPNRKPRIRSLILRLSIFQIVAYLILPIVSPSLSSTRGCWLDATAERLDVVQVDTGSPKKHLAEGPTHLSLGTGLYHIQNFRAGRAAGESCLGRRKRVQETPDPIVQCAQDEDRASVSPQSTNSGNGVQKLIRSDVNLVVEAKLGTPARIEGSENDPDPLPGRIVHYLDLIKQQKNEFPTDIIRERETFHDNMSDYLKFRNEHVILPIENAATKRAQRIMEANEYLGSREIYRLHLDEKEVSLAKELVKLGTSKCFPRWRPIRSHGTIIEVLRSIRTTLYKIRLFNEMCSPPIYKTHSEQEEAQKEAFELLSDFWKNHIFPEIQSEGEDKQKVNPGSIEELKNLAVIEISKRPSRTAGERNSLSWIIFEYWFKMIIPKLSIEIYHKLMTFNLLRNPFNENLDSNLKYYLSDIAIREALEQKKIVSDYFLTFGAEFRLKQN